VYDRGSRVARQYSSGDNSCRCDVDVNTFVVIWPATRRANHGRAEPRAPPFWPSGFALAKP